MLNGQTAIPSAEGWRVHGAYATNNCLEEVGNKIYVGNKSAIFTVNKDDGSLEVLSRVTGLSDVNTTQLQYDKQTRTLVIAYDNLNIDLLQNGIIYNIPDVLNRVIIGDKIVYNITIYDKKAYMACSFGILVIDLERRQLVDI
jgi:hypothetical protein